MRRLTGADCLHVFHGDASLIDKEEEKQRRTSPPPSIEEKLSARHETAEALRKLAGIPSSPPGNRSRRGNRRFATASADARPASLIAPRAPKNDSLISLTSVLSAWALRSPGRRFAAKQILKAFTTKAAVLDLHHMGLSALPKCMDHLVSLQVLNLNDNQLHQLPILPCRLRHLSVNGNQLSYLPELPKSLEELSARANRLVEMPRLPELLRSVNVEDNLLKKLPELPAGLESLNAGQNLIGSFPALPETLSYLSIRANPLKSLPLLNERLEVLQAGTNERGESLAGEMLDYWTYELGRSTRMRVQDNLPAAEGNVSLDEALAEPVEGPSQNLAEVSLPVTRGHPPQRQNFVDAWLSAVQPEDVLIEERQIADELSRFDPRYAGPEDMPAPKSDVYDVDLSSNISFSEFSSPLAADISPLDRLEQYIEMVRVQIERLKRQL